MSGARLRSSVILCTRNRVAEPVRLLESILRGSLQPDELVVVDAGDRPLLSEPAFAAASGRFPRTRMIRSAPGLTRQRNLGVAAARGDLLFFFDDDVVLEPDFLEIMVGRFAAHPEYAGGMGTIAGLAVNPWSPRLLLRRLFFLQRDGGDGRFGPSGLPRHPYGTHAFREVEVLGGGLTAYRRELFARHGFSFDERVGGYAYMEDVDFSFRVSRGFRLFFEPSARLAHLHAPSARPDPYAAGRMQMRNLLHFFRKNHARRGATARAALALSVAGLVLDALLFESASRAAGCLRGLFAPAPDGGGA